MKTNIFRPKSVKDDKVTLEEEQLYSPLLILFKKYGCLAVLFFFLLVFIIIGIILFFIYNLATSHDSNYVDGDLAFEYGDNNVTISETNRDSDWIDKYANVYKKEGIIFVVKIFEVSGDIITYYSDGSSKLVRSDGSIVRISRLPNGDYGIDENGVINSKSKRKSITITKKEELESGTIIIYYSDGSAEIIKDNVTILVRNSKRINLTSDNYELDDVAPSGASYPLKVENVGKYKLTYYTDGTIKVEDSNNTYIVRNREDIDIGNNYIGFPNNNAANIINILRLNDGTIITYYSDGSALINTYYGTEIMVRRSRDIILDGNNSFREIFSGDLAFKSYTRYTPLGDEVTYYDDGSAVIRYSDGKSVYVNENSSIKYDDNGNIKFIDEEVFPEIKTVTTPDNITITYFNNGKSRIEDGDKDYITNSNDVIIDSSGNVVDNNRTSSYQGDNDNKEDNTNGNNDTVSDNNNQDPDDDSKNKDIDDNNEIDGEITGKINDIDDNFYNFIIDNDSISSINYKIVLEESSNYEQYGYQDKVLSAKYIKYDLIFEDNYYEKVSLDNNIWNFNNKVNYVIYEGTLDKKSSLDVMLNIYFDYEDLDNSMQDHLFLGTIKLYIEK